MRGKVARMLRKKAAEGQTMYVQTGRGARIRNVRLDHRSVYKRLKKLWNKA